MMMVAYNDKEGNQHLLEVDAVARKLAVIFYNMMKNKTAFNPKRLQMDTEKQQAIKIARLHKEAAKYGFALRAAA